ncbi:hypothetical protein BCR34DRAFT_548891 [Clohesyomyces aquaticus]|uniref:Uncharacterized protein n=1 Tax=Clohesyomyces aquaticus TaxID=1231657 RepID=A0A1Y1YGM0_9PLEO|nr:hypothetical protein BCR34DRAFT_548891 [Clohesyomyces aquaticus]
MDGRPAHNPSPSQKLPALQRSLLGRPPRTNSLSRLQSDSSVLHITNEKFASLRQERSLTVVKGHGTSRPLKTYAQLQAELESANSIIVELRRNGENWRTLYSQQAVDLSTVQRRLGMARGTISAHLKSNKDLEQRKDVAETRCKELDTKRRDAITAKEKLAGKVGDVERSIARLKKSAYANGKVHQRNLHLKSLIGRKTNKESLLLEALAAAVERIEELENAGDSFLTALEDERDRSSEGSDTSCDSEAANSEGRFMEDPDEFPSSLLQEVRFRGTFDDEEWKEKKDMWHDLLGE